MNVSAAARRLLRGPVASGFLERFGVNVRHFWLLTDLFSALSERRERMGQLGRSGILLKTLAMIYGGVMGLMSLGFATGGMNVRSYLLLFLGLSSLLLFSILMSEISNSLVNPVEALVLAHQPIEGTTYLAASLSHLLRILLYLVPATSAIPALMGLTLKGSHWSYPLVHLLVASATALVLALACCGLFGWLIRFVPAPRLKAVAQTTELLPTLLFIFLGPGRRLVAHIQFPSLLVDNLVLQVTLAAVALSLAIAGVRCLSLDYLARVSVIVHTGSKAKAARGQRTSFFGKLVRRWFGGQAARAGFEFVRRLMLRDWQFRRQLIGFAPSFVVFGAMLAGGWKVSPLSGKFTALHFLPHAFGFILLGVCSALAYGSDYKAVWLFLLVPVPAFRRFGAGVFAALWLTLIVIPHLALLPLLTYAWGLPDAPAFVAFSLAIVSVYLAFSMRLIDGVPFGKQLQANRSAFMLPLLLGFVAVAGVVVAIQYFLVFRSLTAVAVTAAIAGAGAWMGTRSSLGAFERAMRHNLGVMSSESTLLYHEIE